MAIVRVFPSGGSQVLLLPKEFRVNAQRMNIRRQGADLILTPIEDDEWAWLDALEPVDDDYVKAIQTARKG